MFIYSEDGTSGSGEDPYENAGFGTAYGEDGDTNGSYNGTSVYAYALELQALIESGEAGDAVVIYFDGNDYYLEADETGDIVPYYAGSDEGQTSDGRYIVGIAFNYYGVMDEDGEKRLSDDEEWFESEEWWEGDGVYALMTYSDGSVEYVLVHLEIAKAEPATCDHSAYATFQKDTDGTHKGEAGYYTMTIFSSGDCAEEGGYWLIPVCDLCGEPITEMYDETTDGWQYIETDGVHTYVWTDGASARRPSSS